MQHSPAYIIGLKVHCTACEKEFPTDKKHQVLMRDDKPIQCKGCKADLLLSAEEKQRLLGFDNPAKPLMYGMMLCGLVGLLVFGSAAMGLLKSDGVVLITVVGVVCTNLLLSGAFKSKTKHLLLNLAPNDRVAPQASPAQGQ
ncbi:hypothetical protein [Pseudomonas purpurea]|uniref:hypothetical protein n=1 Tax=Pseudomonas purpurea TaxID=3136737 RepID=UPI003266D327